MSRHEKSAMVRSSTSRTPSSDAPPAYPGIARQVGLWLGVGTGLMWQVTSGPSSGVKKSKVVSVDNIYEALVDGVKDKKLQTFYPLPKDPKGRQLQLETMARQLHQSGAVEMIQKMWSISRNYALKLCRLRLYSPIVLLLDDSTSMEFPSRIAGHRTRLDDMRDILHKINEATEIYTEHGFHKRYYNSKERENNCKGDRAREMYDSQDLSMKSNIGKAIRDRIVNELVLPQAKVGKLNAPVLAIVITDGGQDPDDISISRLINATAKELNSLPKSGLHIRHKKPKYGRNAIAFQFAQCGDDSRAEELLQKLDDDRSIGDLVDATSSIEKEAAQMRRAGMQDKLMTGLWAVKLLLGAIDPELDAIDRQTGDPARKYAGMILRRTSTLLSST